MVVVVAVVSLLLLFGPTACAVDVDLFDVIAVIAGAGSTTRLDHRFLLKSLDQVLL